MHSSGQHFGWNAVHINHFRSKRTCKNGRELSPFFDWRPEADYIIAIRSSQDGEEQEEANTFARNDCGDNSSGRLLTPLTGDFPSRSGLAASA